MLSLLSQFDLPGPVQMEEWAMLLAKAWLWATPFLLLLASLGYERHRQRTHIRLLYASLVLTILAKLLVPGNQGHGWGFRYLHGSWFVLPVLAALAMVPDEGRERAKDDLAGPVAWTRAGALAGLVILLPYFAWQAHAFIVDNLRQMPQAATGQPRVILIRPVNFSWDLAQNDPFLRESVIRMVSRGERLDRQMLARYFPDLVLLSQDQRGSVWGYPP
jgi:hypothetical protein